MSQSVQVRLYGEVVRGGGFVREWMHVFVEMDSLRRLNMHEKNFFLRG